MRLAWILAAVALCLVPACSREEDPKTDAPAADVSARSSPPLPARNAGHDYTCSDGVTFNARIDKGRAVVTLEGKSLTLPPVEVSSGAQYAGEGVVFAARGDEALLSRGGAAPVRCTAK